MSTAKKSIRRMRKVRRKQQVRKSGWMGEADDGGKGPQEEKREDEVEEEV